MLLNQLPKELIDHITEFVLFPETARLVGWISVLQGHSPSLFSLSQVDRTFRRACLTLAQTTWPLDLSLTEDLGVACQIIDTFPSPQIYFDSIRQIEYNWNNWDAMNMGWRNDPRGGPLDHAFYPRQHWQHEQALKIMALMEQEEENDHSDRDLHPIERIFGDRIYTNGPDRRLVFQNGSIIWDTTIGAIPQISSIKDVEKTIARIVWLCASLTSIKWSASLYPLPIEVAQALEKRCELRTVIMENEGSHLEIDMSCIPSNCESLSFCYAPSIHYMKGKLFSPPSFNTVVPPTPWLCFLDAPPFGVGIDDSKAPHVRNPPPLHEENLLPLNAWVKGNLEERLLYWMSTNLIQKIKLNSGLKFVGLKSVAPLLLKGMLPVWLALEKVAYAEEAPHMVNREHAQEVNDRGAALRLIRDELQVMAQMRNGCTLKDVVQAWSNNASDCQKEKFVNAEIYRAEMARWVFEDEKLCTAVAMSMEYHAS